MGAGHRCRHWFSESRSLSDPVYLATSESAAGSATVNQNKPSSKKIFLKCWSQREEQSKVINWKVYNLCKQKG